MSEPKSPHLKLVQGPAPVKKKRGAPKKFDWGTPVDDEIHRRLVAGEARETLNQEAKYLTVWLHEKGIRPFKDPEKEYRNFEQGNEFLEGYPSVRNRFGRRYGGAAGYIRTREFHLSKKSAEQAG